MCTQVSSHTHSPCLPARAAAGVRLAPGGLSALWSCCQLLCDLRPALPLSGSSAAVRGGVRSPPDVSLEADCLSHCLCRPFPQTTCRGKRPLLTRHSPPCLPPGSIGSLKNISQCTLLSIVAMCWHCLGVLKNACARVPPWRLWFSYCGDSVGRWTWNRVQESLFLSPPCLRQRPSVGITPSHARAHTHTHTHTYKCHPAWR